jgi:acyl-CoA synthetase (AMP-forming)/AMP-acid ligase II
MGGAPAIGVKVSVDSSGEVLARANVVFDGYWQQPEATAEAVAADGSTLAKAISSPTAAVDWPITSARRRSTGSSASCASGRER